MTKRTKFTESHDSAARSVGYEGEREIRNYTVVERLCRWCGRGYSEHIPPPSDAFCVDKEGRARHTTFEWSAPPVERPWFCADCGRRRMMPIGFPPIAPCRCGNKNWQLCAEDDIE
jgi:hypothetical protein